MNTDHFYELCDDVESPGRWYLDGVIAPGAQDIDPRDFNEGQWMNAPSSLTVRVRNDGRPLDFTFADFRMPVVTRTVGAMIADIAPNAVQCIPVTVAGQQQPYDILNVTSRCRCIDESRSSIVRWTPRDGRPDKVGQYRMITTLRVDRVQAAGKQIFRCEGWKIVVIVSEQLKDLFDRNRISGVCFRPV
jgi:hypothetical protein